MAELNQKYAVGMRVEGVREGVRATYPRYVEYPGVDCSKAAKNTTPVYEARGGPCIFGIRETGSTWWGFESAVSFRLIFDPEGVLVTVQVYREYTFL